MLDEKHNNNYYGRSNTHVCSNHQTEHNYYSRNHNEIRLFSCSSQHKLTLRATNLMLLFTWPHSRKWSMQSMLQTSSALITQTNVFEKTFVDYQSMMGRCASNIAQQGPKMARRAYNRGYQFSLILIRRPARRRMQRIKLALIHYSNSSSRVPSICRKSMDVSNNNNNRSS